MNTDSLKALPKIKRVVSYEEALDSPYADMAELSVIFNHDIVEMDDGVWRWRPNRLVSLIEEYCPVYQPSGLENKITGKMAYGRHCNEGRASLSLNGLAIDRCEGLFSVEEYMKFYMQTGYSLGGFSDIFCQHEASEYNLPGAKTEFEPGQDTDYYMETVIEYMLRIHKGEVLKI